MTTSRPASHTGDTDLRYSKASGGSPACLWFASEPIMLPVPLTTRPAGVAITFGSACGPFGWWGTPGLTTNVRQLEPDHVETFIGEAERADKLDQEAGR